MRETDYAKELARADIGGHRIERLLIKSKNEEEIRFSWWTNGRMANRPLDLSEDELLPLLKEAIRNKVFSDAFLRDLHTALYDCRPGCEGTD